MELYEDQPTPLEDLHSLELLETIHSIEEADRAALICVLD